MNNILWNCFDYHEDIGESLFDVLKKEYAINKVLVNFKNGDEITVEKFNVIGWDLSSNIFKLYDTSYCDKLLCSFDFNDVESIYKI